MNRNKNFWIEASVGGAVIGAVDGLLNMVKVWNTAAGRNSMGISLVALLVFVWLIYFFVRRRARLNGAEGFTYGAGVGFVAAMMLFAGVVAGLLNALASNFLLADAYEVLTGQSMALLENMSIYQGLSEWMGQMMHFITFNPLGTIVSGVMNEVIVGVLWGLLVSAMLVRNNNPLIDPDNRPQE